ncbi:hypothetical protein PF003_g32360 [Phytophthora fragariae]|nr:hypothetical protein PF003_g32360 [Phytophthora fragariae]
MLDGERVGEKRHRGGRRPSPVWAFFTEIRTPDNKVHACCNFCGKRGSGVASRLRTHVLSKCEKAPTDIERLLGEAIAPMSRSTTIHTTSTVVIAADLSMDTACGSDTGTSFVSPAPAKRRRPQVQQTQQVIAPAEEEIRPAVDQDEEEVENEDVEAEVDEDEEVGDTQVIYDPPRVLSEGFTEQEAAQVRQKLVLACVLNDVPASFVEDEALMEAFTLARPGLPRLSAEQAKSTVLQELANTATKKMEEELAKCEVLTLVHRHFKKQDGAETRASLKWCNQWVGVDEHRKVVPLKETYREVESSILSSDEGCCRYCSPRREFDEVVSNFRLSMAPEAVFCLCCECPLMYQQLKLEQQQALSTPVQDADSVSAIASKSLLLSACLLRQSLVLRKGLLNTFPEVVDVLNKTIFLAHSISKITPLRPQVETLLKSSNWDAVPRLVKRMVFLERDVRRYQAKVCVPSEEVSSFWNKLRVVDKFLTPFNWMLALSEAKETTSAQYVVLWLWLLSIVESTTSQLLPDQDKACFTSTVMSLIGHHIDSHELVCMLLDPRIAGAGLSISGKRRVKSLVVQVAERLFPSEGFGSGAARSQLLTQLGDYTEKSGGFEDVVAWEMSAGRPPKLFWNDFVEDAPHLARVARAVISVSPCAQTATQSLDPSPPTEEFAWEQSFEVRQLKFQAQKLPPPGTGGVQQYQMLLFPPAPLQGSMSDGALSSEVDKALRVNNTPRWSASVESEAEAYVTRQLSLMLTVGGDNEIEGQHLLPTPTTATTSQSIGLSWFAFQSSTDRNVLEQAVRNFLPRPATATNLI